MLNNIFNNGISISNLQMKVLNNPALDPASKKQLEKLINQGNKLLLQIDEIALAVRAGKKPCNASRSKPLLNSKFGRTEMQVNKIKMANLKYVQKCDETLFHFTSVLQDLGLGNEEGRNVTAPKILVTTSVPATKQRNELFLIIENEDQKSEKALSDKKNIDIGAGFDDYLSQKSVETYDEITNCNESTF